jgi:hypothetical protein
MIFFIGLTIFLILLGISITVNIIFAKRYIDLFNENAIEKIKDCNYKLLEIKRKRRPQRLNLNNTSAYYESQLEKEYPIPWSILPPEDIIEVYGIENNNKYLLFKIEWSKENAQKIKIIVSDINNLIKTEND